MKMETRKIVCNMCGDEKVLTADKQSWAMYDSGEFNVQTCFPDMDIDDREILTSSGVCGTCFDTLFV